MASGVDIGALSGRIEFEDHATATMDKILGKVDQLEANWSTMGGRVAESAAGFFTAEAAIKAVETALSAAVEVIKDMTVEGAGMADIAENFEKLTEGAGRLSSTLLNELRQGTHSTIDDMTLMKTVNQDLAAGMNLTDQEFRRLADGAFALAQATGGDVAEAFETVNRAMLTGQTRSVQLLTGKIDLVKAEQDLAESLGVTVDQLSAEGKLQAARTGILDAVTAATKRLGDQTDGLDEMVAQLGAEWTNFYNDLAQSVATSPQVIQAFETIRDSIRDAFGGESQSLAEVFLSWVNRAADAVTTYGPTVVEAFVKIKDWVAEVYTTVRAGWDTLPEWFRNAATNTAIAVTGFTAVNTAVKGLSGGVIDFISVAGNLTTWLSGMPAALANVTAGFETMRSLVTVLDFTSLANARASIVLLGESLVGLLGPMGAVAAAAGAIFAAWEIGKMEPVSDFFQKLGLMVQGYSKAETEAIIQTDKLMTAQNKQAQETKAQEEAIARAREMVRGFKEETEGAATGVEQTNAALERNRLVLEQTNEELKKRRTAMEEIASSSKTWQETVALLNEDMVVAIKQYLEAGVAQDKLATAYGLTATQINAVAKSLKEEQDALALEQKQIQDSEKRWADYYATKREMSGNATDKLTADIDRWTAAQIQSHQKQKTDTADFYNWLDATRKQSFEKADNDRLQQDQHSKAFWEKQAKDAKEYYDFAMAHSDQFTKEYIDHLRKTKDAAADAAKNWKENMGGALDEVSQKVRTLSGEMITLQEKQQRMSAGGSFTINRGNLAENARTWGIPPNVAVAAAEKGFSFQEILTAWQNNMIDKWVPQGPRIPGFRDGGIGDFGEGTLAMLHGKEAIVPLDKGPGLGSIEVNQYINGTAADVARQVSRELMRTLKQYRQFGAA